MDRRMLINALHSEERRIAIVESSNLVELELESHSGKKLKGNIYKARVSRIEPSLQAAFVDIGTQRNGFLQINDIHPAYYRQGSPASGRVSIQDVLRQDQEIVVQVVKEERELKGATLTTFISLPGRYIVLMPGSDRGGVSRKIIDADQRKRMRNLAKDLEIPAGMGIIIRTAGIDRSQSELSRDLALQLKLWERIVTGSQGAPCPMSLYQESDLATRVVRDYFTPEIREIITDDKETFARVKEFVGQVMPRYRSRVRLFEENQPLFSYYNIEDQVSETMVNEVKLKGGGAIVIDSLEALVAIDVNSGKSTSSENIEETAYLTNLEAADEIARQLRLRDLGGLVVIDFIDMMDRRHKAAVEKRFCDAVKLDKARIEVGKISKFGLLELSRQRIRGTLTSQSHLKCSHCQGKGSVKNPELVALEALRKIQSAVVVGHVSMVKARLSPAAALFLLNMKKAELYQLESQHQVHIYILADGRLRADEYEFEMDSKRDLNQQTSAQSLRSGSSNDQSIRGGSHQSVTNKQVTQKLLGSPALPGPVHTVSNVSEAPKSSDQVIPSESNVIDQRVTEPVQKPEGSTASVAENRSTNENAPRVISSQEQSSTTSRDGGRLKRVRTRAPRQKLDRTAVTAIPILEPTSPSLFAAKVAAEPQKSPSFGSHSSENEVVHQAVPTELGQDSYLSEKLDPNTLSSLKTGKLKVNPGIHEGSTVFEGENLSELNLKKDLPSVPEGNKA